MSQSIYPKVPSATLSAVADSASSVTLAAANTARCFFTLVNDSTEILYLKYGATASLTSYTYKIAAGGTWEMPSPIYTGIIDGIWANNAAGSAYITQMP